MSYAKLFSTITESSLWSSSKETRLLFVSMLARANAVGFIEASVPGLARISNLTREETDAALRELTSPDPDDKSGNNDGRRIVKMDGGWGIVNYEAYRNRRDEQERREYMREYMTQYRKRTVNSVNDSKPQLAKAEAEAEAEVKEINTLAQPTVERVHVEPDLFPEFWALYDKAKGKDRAIKKWASLSMKVRRQIMEALPAYVHSTPDKQYRMDPTTYLNGKRWEDEIVSADEVEPQHGSDAWFNWHAARGTIR